MQCEDARALLQANAYEEQRDPTITTHLEGCADCRAYAAQLELLGQLLDADEATTPRPGFDTRFFARLAEVKKEKRQSAPGTMRWLRWMIAAVPVAAVATILMMAVAPEAEPALEDDLALAMELEMLEDLEVVRSLDEVEAYEVLAQLEVEELDQMLEGVPQ